MINWLLELWGMLKANMPTHSTSDPTEAFHAPQTAPDSTAGPASPQTAPPTPQPAVSLLTRFCLAIQSREGYCPPGVLAGYPEGTPAYVNKNPGNLRCEEGQRASWNALAIDGGAKHADFCVFKDYATGFDALMDVVESACKGESPTYNARAKELGLHDSSYLSIRQYFVIRDPSSDNNDPLSFATEVAQKCGLTVDSMMKEVIA